MKKRYPINLCCNSTISGGRHVRLIFLILMMAFSVALPDRARSHENCTGVENPVIASVDGNIITVQDIEDKQINDLRAELYKRLESKMQLQALKKLSEKYPKYTLNLQPEISDKAISDFYRQNNLQTRGTLEDLKPRIMALLQMQAISKYYNTLYQEAVKKGLIISYLKQPNEYLVGVPVETAYLWGNKRAQVMVMEFSDYQCPFCSRVQATIKRLRKTYQNRVIFGYRHSPLAFHKEADEAAIAVECARDQGKFAPYHNTLFNNYRKIRIGAFEGWAKEVAVKNLKLFKKCLNIEKYRNRVENDQKAATAAGIRGTPGFIIGKYDSKTGTITGEVLSGAQPESAFVETIEKYLRKK